MSSSAYFDGGEETEALVQDVAVEPEAQLDLEADEEFGGRESRKIHEQRLLRKLDVRMSILVLIYILNYVDRNNVSNLFTTFYDNGHTRAARLRGFETDLNLRGQEFNTLLSILYVGYIIMQVPSNMFLNHIGKPSLYLPGCMIIWGILSILTGASTNYHTALATRFLLGFVEAAFFPGALFLLSRWYKGSELGARTALLSCGILISNAFGSLMASAILDTMQGTLGSAAWRWLFYVEGMLTILVAIFSMFILPDFPATSGKWLTPLEIRLAERRMEEDVGILDKDDTEPENQVKGLMLALFDWKVWWLGLVLACMITSLSFNAFFPTLSATMGYSRTVTLLLCAPPWVFATVVAFVLARHSDKAQERFKHTCFSLGVGILGFVIAYSTMNTAARYLSLFLMAQSFGAFIIFLAWVSNSIPRPASKRAVALAFINAFGQLGNIVGSYVWPKQWEPTYRKSYVICTVASCMCMLMCFVFKKHLESLNRDLREKELLEDRPTGFRYLT